MKGIECSADQIFHLLQLAKVFPASLGGNWKSILATMKNIIIFWHIRMNYRKLANVEGLLCYTLSHLICRRSTEILYK